MKKLNIGLLCCAIFGITFLIINRWHKKDDVVDINTDKQQQTVKIDNDAKFNDNNIQVSIDKSIVINAEFDKMKNPHIKEIVEDKKEILKNGVYGCISKDEGNYYIFINGVDYWYSNISFNIKDKLLTISYNTEHEKGLRIKHLFMINPNNIETFDKVVLINNGNKEDFKILFNQ
jgi:hypothetical protein